MYVKHVPPFAVRYWQRWTSECSDADFRADIQGWFAFLEMLANDFKHPSIAVRVNCVAVSCSHLEDVRCSSAEVKVSNDDTGYFTSEMTVVNGAQSNGTERKDSENE
jgi:hypothetical protein